VTDYVEQKNLFNLYSNDVIQPESVVTMVLGPFCMKSFREVSNGSWEWMVDTPGQTGLGVAENDAEGYFLEPVNP
jgi:hypothetical protein